MRAKVSAYDKTKLDLLETQKTKLWMERYGSYGLTFPAAIPFVKIFYTVKDFVEKKWNGER